MFAGASSAATAGWRWASRAVNLPESLEKRMSKPEEFKFDSRVRERFLRSRVLTSAELQKHLEQLPDLEGDYEVMSDTPQPAVAPPRSEVNEEPLVFEGIRRLQALSEASAP